MTYSIVARDSATGALGVAVQSHWFSVGQMCPWARAGVGAVATQAMVEPAYGPRLLALLETGMAPDDALRGLVEADRGRAQRQVAVIAADGHVAAHTGDRCIAACGHRTGDGVSVQGNMLARDEVWSSMLEAYEAARGVGVPLADRLLAALDEAEAHGGDARGRQSAALLVVGDDAVDVRVDDHELPLVELRRLVELQRTSRMLGRAQQLILEDVEAGTALFEEVQARYGDNKEPSFWAAALLAGLGRTDDAAGWLRAAAASHDGWVELLANLPPSGAVPLTGEQVEAVLRAAALG